MIERVALTLAIVGLASSATMGAARMLGAALASILAAAVSGVLLARVRPAHGPARTALVSLALASILRASVVLPFLRPLARPVTGPGLALVFLDGALALASSAIVPGLALASTAERPRRAVAAVAATWALASVVLAVAYPAPMVRGDSLAGLYLDADLSALLVSALALSALAFNRTVPTSPQAVALVLTLSGLAIDVAPFSPWRTGVFALVARWDVPQIMILATFATLTIYQVVSWLYYRRLPSS